MHDIRFIRENPAAFDRGLVRRGLEPQSAAILAEDKALREVVTELQTMQSRRNDASKAIGAAKAKGGNADSLMAEVAAMKTKTPDLEAQERGLGEALNKPKGRVYLRSCDAVLGDRRCGVDLDAAAYSVEATVLGCDAGNVRLAAPGAFADGWFARGSIEWLSGANAGLGGVIKTDRQGASGRMLALWQEPPFPVVAGDLAKLAAGCDKAAATCKAKFGNFMNFRGFPDMPGDDWVVSYPGRGERLDGGSLHNDQ